MLEIVRYASGKKTNKNLTDYPIFIDIYMPSVKLNKLP